MKRNRHKSCLIKLFTRACWSQSHTNNGFFKLVEALLHIYSCFFSHSVKLQYTWLTAISSVTVSLHYLPRCLCSTVTCRTPILWFQINPDCTPKKTYSYNKNPERLCYEQKHMSVPVWIETTIEYWFNYSSTSKFFSAAQTFNIWTQLDDLSVVQNVFITLVTYSVDDISH